MSKGTELIVLETKPVIKYDFSGVLGKVNEISELVLTVNESTSFEDLKVLRRELNREFDAIDGQRIALEKLYKQPLKEFHNDYKAQVSGPVEKSRSILAGLISKAEAQILADKSRELEGYANEYLKSLGVDEIPFEKLGVRFTPAEEITPIKKRLRERIEGIQQELIAIDGLPNSKAIKEQYLISLDLTRSIQEVNRAMAIAEQVIETRVEEKVERKLEELQVEVPEESKVVVEDIVEEVEDYEFRVTATQSQMLKLIAFMEREGIIYE